VQLQTPDERAAAVRRRGSSIGSSWGPPRAPPELELVAGSAERWAFANDEVTLGNLLAHLAALQMVGRLAVYRPASRNCCTFVNELNMALRDMVARRGPAGAPPPPASPAGAPLPPASPAGGGTGLAAEAAAAPAAPASSADPLPAASDVHGGVAEAAAVAAEGERALVAICAYLSTLAPPAAAEGAPAAAEGAPAPAEGAPAPAEPALAAAPAAPAPTAPAPASAASVSTAPTGFVVLC
jgi:hypothetical protein